MTRRQAEQAEDLRFSFIGGMTYACESIVALLEQRAQHATDFGASLGGLVIRGDAQAVRKWLERELEYELPPNTEEGRA